MDVAENEPVIETLGLGTDPDDGTETWRARLGVVLQSWRDHGRWRVGELLDPQGRQDFHELVRRMARRESGSRVEARRDRAMRRPV